MMKNVDLMVSCRSFENGAVSIGYVSSDTDVAHGREPALRKYRKAFFLRKPT